jgi:hypothetical protein
MDMTKGKGVWEITICRIEPGTYRICMHRNSSTMHGERRTFLSGVAAFGGAFVLPALPEQTKATDTSRLG